MKLVLCEEIEVQVEGPSSCGTILGVFTTSYKKIGELAPGGRWLTRLEVARLLTRRETGATIGLLLDETFGKEEG